MRAFRFLGAWIDLACVARAGVVGVLLAVCGGGWEVDHRFCVFLFNQLDIAARGAGGGGFLLGAQLHRVRSCLATGVDDEDSGFGLIEIRVEFDPQYQRTI